MKKYFIYPKSYSYKNTDGFPKNTIYMPIIACSTYNDYFCNEHHFKPFYHIEYVLPILERELKFGYKRTDFILNENFDKEHDISFLTPKNNFQFDIYDITKNENINNVYFNYLRQNLTKDKTGDLYKITKYHQLFTFAHKSCQIINKTINNDRKLIISCDSQMIPIIPVLCCYFKEIWVLDKREEYSCDKTIEDINPTDIIVAGGYYSSNKYLNKNFQALKTK